MSAEPVVGEERKGAQTGMSSLSFMSRSRDFDMGAFGIPLEGLGYSNRRKAARMRENFVEEIRLLSKLRHPCITTVMGAVMSSGCEPMMVMEYMENGSL